MRRLATSFLALLLLFAAALVPGAAAFAADPSPTPTDARCISVTSDALTQAVEASKVILLGSVQSVDDSRVVLTPRAFLKGSAPAGDLEIGEPSTASAAGCDPAHFQPGADVLLFLTGQDRHLYWPSASQAFLLENGRAVQQADGGWGESGALEDSLISTIQRQTEQYAVPSTRDEGGAGMDWWKTVVPVGIASFLLLGIGLYLMRIWHRIDPS